MLSVELAFKIIVRLFLETCEYWPKSESVQSFKNLFYFQARFKMKILSPLCLSLPWHFHYQLNSQNCPTLRLKNRTGIHKTFCDFYDRS